MMSLEPSPEEAPTFFLITDLRSWALDKMCRIASVPLEKPSAAMFAQGQQHVLADLLSLIEELNAK
jgi:hypothetical protein